MRLKLLLIKQDVFRDYVTVCVDECSDTSIKLSLELTGNNCIPVVGGVDAF